MDMITSDEKVLEEMTRWEEPLQPETQVFFVVEISKGKIYMYFSLF